MKMLNAALRMVRRQLVDPKSAEIVYWQAADKVYIPATSRYGQGSHVDTVTYQGIIRIHGKQGNDGRPFTDFYMSENTGIKVGPFLGSRPPHNPKATTAKEFAAHIIKNLGTWEGVKGETEAKEARRTIANQVAKALGRALSGWSIDEPEISDDFKRIQGGYRSDLPKEGAQDVGYYDYRDMVEREVAKYRKKLNPLLMPYIKYISDIDIHDGEKSWIYTTITLK